MVVVTTRDGRTYSGNVVGENARQITLRIVGQDAVIINKSDIQSREETPVSMMPPGLFETLSDGEVLDLVAYLKQPGLVIGKDKQVRVRGKIVKYNAGIMGKNWIHLRDGSGVAADDSHDVLVTTTARAKLGDVVTVVGVVHTNQDLGSGYFYKVLIEEATLQP